jgi:hypothetical protein
MKAKNLSGKPICRYWFSSPRMRPTSAFDLLTQDNLQRLGISIQQIDHAEPFEYLPGTLYPERGNFSETHPAGGSFGVHIYLKNGEEAWLYGRISYDYNPDRDHRNGQRHWNYDIVGIMPDGRTLDPYTRMSYHGLPDSPFLEVSVETSLGRVNTYTIARPEMAER